MTDCSNDNVKKNPSRCLKDGTAIVCVSESERLCKQNCSRKQKVEQEVEEEEEKR